MFIVVVAFALQDLLDHLVGDSQPVKVGGQAASKKACQLCQSSFAASSAGRITSLASASRFWVSLGAFEAMLPDPYGQIFQIQKFAGAPKACSSSANSDCIKVALNVPSVGEHHIGEGIGGN